MRDVKRIYRILNYLNIFWNRPECQDMRFWQMMSYLGAKVFDETSVQISSIWKMTSLKVF